MSTLYCIDYYCNRINDFDKKYRNGTNSHNKHSQKPNVEVVDCDQS